MRKQNGITLIALVISIIVMLILAGVSINAIVGENGVLSRAQYSSFLNEMAAVEEAVQLWKAGELIESKGQVSTAIPANGLWETNNLIEENISEATKRLIGEIGYYRVWSIAGNMPENNILSVDDSLYNAFKGEFVGYPAGVQDLYYLNNEALGLDENKLYLIDATTSMVYSTTGISINGVRCYSTYMSKAVMGNNMSPVFAEAEVSGTGAEGALAGNVQEEFLPDGTPNPNYNPNGFQIISGFNNNNIYKLYNNGDLYAKGVKGNLLNTSQEKLENIDSTEWKELIIPSEIGDYKQIIPGFDCVYVIDNNDELWAWGTNSSNKFGLTKEQQIEYTGRYAIKLNVENKKIYKVFCVQNATFVVTISNGIYELYAAGYNSMGGLGVGDTESHDRFVKCIGLSNPETLYSIEAYTNPVVANIFVCKKDNILEVYQSGLNRFSKDYYTNFVEITRILDGNYGENFANNIKQIKLFAGANMLVLTNDGILKLATNENGHISLGGITNKTFTSKTFGLNDTEILNITNIYGGSTYYINVFERTDNNGNKFYYLYSIDGSWLGLEENTKLYDFTNDIPEDLLLDGIKNIRISGKTLYLIGNSGKVYAAGLYAGLGLGKNVVSSPVGFVCLTEETAKLNNALPLVNDVAYWSNIETSIPTNTMFFEGQNGKIYVTGNLELMFRDNILEQSWIKIATNVKKINANTAETSQFGYIDKENNLWILGDNSLVLGVGATEQYSIKNFVKITDYLEDDFQEEISNNVDEVYFANGAVYILTLDKKLYVSGVTTTTQWPYNYMIGIEEDSNKFIKLLENVEYCSIRLYGKYAIVKDENNVLHFYTWGLNDVGAVLGGDSKIPKEFTTLPFELNKIKKISVSQRMCYIITTDGELYVLGVNRTTGAGINGINTSVTVFTKFEETIFNSEKIIDICSLDVNSNTTIVLTEAGNLYGWGVLSRLGMGSESQTYQMTPIKLNITNVMSICAGKGFFTCIKNDGTVWGTGSNQYGILGRWIGIDRDSPNSRYKTAFDWVECPELEI